MTLSPQTSLGDAEHQFRLLVENVRDYALFFTDPERRIVTWNVGAERIMGWAEAEMIGQSADIIFVPEDRDQGDPDKEAGKAVREGRAENERWHLRKDGSRFWGSGILTALKDEHGNLRGFCKIFRDKTEQRQAEAQLRERDARLQFALDCAHMAAWDLDLATGTATRDLRHDQIFGYEALLPEWNYDLFLQHVHPDDRAFVGERFGQALQAGTDWEFECRIVRADGALRWIWARGMPYRDQDGTPLRLLGAVADITERKQTEARLASAFERERLLNQIGQAIRATIDPGEIQAAAVTALGQALRTDRCGFVLIDTARNRMQIVRDWHRADLPPLAGEYRLSRFGVDVDELFGAERSTLVVEDVRHGPWSDQNVAALEQIQMRALLEVPFYESGRLVAVLAVAMADAPRAWTADEVALVEAVATETRTAVESARLQLREHNIAQQLQSALQPPLPEVVPGLELGHRSRAALDEAEVGGDFSDVFVLEKGCTALVVGDLSGKGLAAAAQVATVRNMLRFALYNGRTLDEGITALNRTLAENHLIDGFVTLFVGCYDSGNGTLTYVNCGQEPALVRRAATGQVEELGTTGPVLGSMETAEFEERVASLSPGDTLAVFTDGLTEAGPSRADMMGVAGVAALLAQQPPGEESASALAQRMVAGVDAYAQGGVRDDIALLVGVVGGSNSNARHARGQTLGGTVEDKAYDR